MTDPVLYEKHEHILTITLNRPEKRNALSDELFPALEDALKRAATDKARVTILRGSGEAFCSGADLSFLGNLGASGDKQAVETQDRQQYMQNYYRRFLRLADLPMPTIAAVNGFAVGAGFALCLAADLRIAANEAKMGATFAKIGIPPGGGTSFLLPRLVGLPRAFELLYTGRLIDGSEAERIGLVNRSVPRSDIDRVAFELASEIAANAPRSVRAAKRTVLAGLNSDWSTSMELEAWGQVTLAASPDAKEGIAAIRDRRKPTFNDD